MTPRRNHRGPSTPRKRAGARRSDRSCLGRASACAVRCRRDPRRSRRCRRASSRTLTTHRGSTPQPLAAGCRERLQLQVRVTHEDAGGDDRLLLWSISRRNCMPSAPRNAQGTRSMRSSEPPTSGGRRATRAVEDRRVPCSLASSPSRRWRQFGPAPSRRGAPSEDRHVRSLSLCSRRQSPPVDPCPVSPGHCPEANRLPR